jgi:segregation and condensation protein B
MKKLNLDEEISMDLTLKALLEGILFVFGEEGISLSELQEALDIEGENLVSILKEMQEQYLDERYGFELIIIQDKYKLISKVQVHDAVNRILSLSKSKQLSQSALETLAIIAYRQPITRHEIESIRGVGCELMLKKLQAMDLIDEAARADLPGRPILYQVTESFLDVFKLMDLSQLPNLPDFTQESSDNQLFE